MTTPFDDPQAELAWMFLQSLCDGGDLDEGFALLSEGFTYWSIKSRALVDKATLWRMVERRKQTLEIDLDLIRCFNEGDDVVVEAEITGVTTAGIRCDSPVVFIFETRDGLIVSLREYSDTQLATQAFPNQPRC
jgi:ketosteroid isomerase-like protein